MRVASRTALALTILLATGMAYFYFGLFIPQARVTNAQREMGGGVEYGCDLYPIWLTGRELFRSRSDPYTPDVTLRIQTGLYGRPMDQRRATDPPSNYRAFAYPLYADLVASPLLPFGFSSVRLAVSFLLPILTAVSVLLWAKFMRLPLTGIGMTIAIVLTMVSYPLLEGLYAQQPALLVGLMLAAAMFAMDHGRLILSGILLAAASIKPQLVLPLVAWLVAWCVADWGRRKNFVIGFGVAMALLIAASEALVPGWHRGWYHSVVDYQTYTPLPLSELVLGKTVGYLLSFTILGVALLVGWRTRHEPMGSSGFALGLSTILAASLLLLPSGVAVYDQVALLPGVLWLWGRRDMVSNASWPMRGLAILLVGAIGWQWIAGTLVAAVSLVAPAWAQSPSVLVLPFRTAASLPFIVLAVLGCMAFSENRSLASMHTAMS